MRNFWLEKMQTTLLQDVTAGFPKAGTEAVKRQRTASPDAQKQMQLPTLTMKQKSNLARRLCAALLGGLAMLATPQADAAGLLIAEGGFGGVLEIKSTTSKSASTTASPSPPLRKFSKIWRTARWKRSTPFPCRRARQWQTSACGSRQGDDRRSAREEARA
jgi:hypothetical protein